MLLNYTGGDSQFSYSSGQLFMGIHNRDYYRSDATTGGWSGSPTRSMCQILLIVTIAVYLLQILITVPHRYAVEGEPVIFYESLVQEWGELDPVKVSQGQIWRLLTYAFLHSRDSIFHIAFNMLALWMFGTAIEELLGRREFLLFYLISAIASGLCHVLFGFAMGDPTPAVGASGAVIAVSMLFAIYYPTAPINIYFIFTIEARWLIILYLVYDAFPILLALGGRGARSDGIAHAAHLGGLAFGFLYYQFHWKLSGWIPTRGGPSLGQKLTKWWTRPRLRVYQSPAERPAVRTKPPISSRDLERRVDEILKKIKEQGEASLTDDERNLLRDASQAYKKRNT